jgi:hypothetical protein
MIGDDYEAIIVQCRAVGAVFGAAPGTKIMFGAILKEATSKF